MKKITGRYMHWHFSGGATQTKKFFNIMDQWETVAENNPITINAIAGTQRKHNRKGYWHRTSVC